MHSRVLIQLLPLAHQSKDAPGNRSCYLIELKNIG